MDEDGWHWKYVSDDGWTIGHCEYLYIKLNGQYLYRGTFYYGVTDFELHDEPIREEFNSLSDCARWIMHWTFGGYYCGL